MRLFDLEYLQRCVATNTEIVMYLAPRRNLHALTDDSRYLFEAEERFLATDPVVHFDHAVLQSTLAGVPLTHFQVEGRLPRSSPSGTSICRLQ